MYRQIWHLTLQPWMMRVSCNGNRNPSLIIFVNDLNVAHPQLQNAFADIGYQHQPQGACSMPVMQNSE